MDAALSDELESGRSLYMRAHQVGAATRVEVAKAIEHYRNALFALQTSSHADAELARPAITEAIQRLG